MARRRRAWRKVEEPSRRLTADQRARIGARLRGLRAQAGLRIQDVADRVRVAPNTILAIEHASYDVRVATIEAVAMSLHTTLDDILAPVGSPADPGIADLNVDHLFIAHAYRNARNHVRSCVEELLAGSFAEAVVLVAVKVLHAPCERAPHVEALLEDTEQFLSVVTRLRARLTYDDTYWTWLLEQLDLEDRRKPLPKTRHPRATPLNAAAPPRLA